MSPSNSVRPEQSRGTLGYVSRLRSTRTALILSALLLGTPAFADSSLPPSPWANRQLPDPRQEARARALMEELRHDGIRVSSVLPGSVATEFSGRAAGSGAEWRLLAEDVALAVVTLLEHPPRSLPSRVEIRPSRPVRR